MNKINKIKSYGNDNGSYPKNHTKNDCDNIKRRHIIQPKICPICNNSFEIKYWQKPFLFKKQICCSRSCNIHYIIKNFPRRKIIKKSKYDICSCGKLKDKRAKFCIVCFKQNCFKNRNKCNNCGKDIVKSSKYCKICWIKLYANRDNLNPNFNIKVGYHGIHSWVRRRKNKPKLCEMCNLVKPLDLANISGKYKRDINDFEWLCRKCHMVKDGRLDKFILMSKEKAWLKK